MTTEHKYKVFPDEPKPIQKIEPNIKEAEGISMGWGCLVWGGIYVVLGMPVMLVVRHMYKIDGEAGIGGTVGIISATAVTIIVHYYLKSERAAQIAYRRTTEAKENEDARVIREAASVTTDLRHIYESSSTLAAEISEHIKEVSLWLENAEEEYKENAFAPFWDAIEEAAHDLSAYDEKVKRIAKDAKNYYQALDKRKHSFPLFPVQPETIPDASPVLNEFRRVVRLGLTSPTFALIWEHYKDRKVMMAGFRYLGEAVNNLGYVIEDSISNLQESMSSDVAKIVEAEIKTREVIADTGKKIDKRLLEQNRMLDNIQHNRKPKFKDTPSKN